MVYIDKDDFNKIKDCIQDIEIKSLQNGYTDLNSDILEIIAILIHYMKGADIKKFCDTIEKSCGI